MHIRKLVFYLKIFLDLPISGIGRKNELAQKVPRKAVDEQSGASPEGGDIHLNDRPGGKREKLPPGNKTKDYSCIGAEAI